jgi:hypothetical protein
MHIEFIKGSRLRRVAMAGLLALAAAGLATGGPLAAHASDLDNCGPNFVMTCAGAFESVAVNGNNADAVASCTAALTTDTAVAVAVGVHCYLVGQTDGLKYESSTGTLWTDGEVSTTAAAFVNVPSQRYQLCIEAGYVTPLGVTNDTQNAVCGGVVIL